MSLRSQWYILYLVATMDVMKTNSLLILQGKTVKILSVSGNPSLTCYILLMSLGHLLKVIDTKNKQLISCTAMAPSAVRCPILCLLRNS